VATESHAIATPHAVDEHGDGHGHGLLQHQFDDLQQQRECDTLGMWLFLATELMMFGGLFFAYTLYRHLYPYAFHLGSHHLNITLGTANTFVLLASSFTMAMGVHSAATRNHRAMLGWLFITVLFGVAFLGIKAVEWTADYNEGIMPAVRWTYPAGEKMQDDIPKLAEHATTPQMVMMYFIIYFMMTGLHGIHMLVGVLLVSYFMFLQIRHRMFTNGNDQPVEIVGLYWHLVDIIWIFLFPLLYLIAGFHPGGGGG
jgi:cytochrome c oxidase subunit III